MKKLVITIYLLIGAVVPLMAELEQVRIDLKYKGVEAKWFSDNEYQKRGEIIELPSILAKFGQKVAIEIIREFSIDRDKPSGFVVPCGVIVKLEPKMKDGVLVVAGKNLLRRPTNGSSGGIATHFESQETLFNLKIEEGGSNVVNLESGGQLLITATIIDSTGQVIKK